MPCCTLIFTDTEILSTILFHWAFWYLSFTSLTQITVLTAPLFSDQDAWLTNNGKKIVCLWSELKSRHVGGRFHSIVMSYYENVCSYNRLTVAVALFYFCMLALYFLGLVAHYHESILKYIIISSKNIFAVKKVVSKNSNNY